MCETVVCVQGRCPQKHVNCARPVECVELCLRDDTYEGLHHEIAQHISQTRTRLSAATLPRCETLRRKRRARLYKSQKRLRRPSRGASNSVTLLAAIYVPLTAQPSPSPSPLLRAHRPPDRASLHVVRGRASARLPRWLPRCFRRNAAGGPQFSASLFQMRRARASRLPRWATTDVGAWALRGSEHTRPK